MRSIDCLIIASVCKYGGNSANSVSDMCVNALGGGPRAETSSPIEVATLSKGTKGEIEIVGEIHQAK